MPRKRDPSVFTTSISGIPDEAWAAFREEVEKYKKYVDKGYTLRKALEEAIFRLSENFKRSPKDIEFIPATQGRVVPIQMSELARDALKHLSETTGHKHNVLFLTAMFTHARKLYDDSWHNELSLAQEKYVKVRDFELRSGSQPPRWLVEMIDEIRGVYRDKREKDFLRLHQRMLGKHRLSADVRDQPASRENDDVSPHGSEKPPRY